MKRFTSLLVFAALGVSLIGDEIYLAIITLYLEQRGSGLGLSTFFLAQLVPAALLGTFIGGVSDRFETSKVLTISLLIQGLTVLLLLVNQSTPALIAAAFALGIAVSISQPALYALMPNFAEALKVPEQRANAFLEFFVQGGYFLGPVIGGVIFDFASIEQGLQINAATFFIAAFAVAVVRVRRPPDPQTRVGFIKAIRVGSAPLFTDKRLRLIFPVLLLITLCVYLVPIPFVFLTREIVGVSGTVYGVFLGVWAAGMLVSSSLLGVYDVKNSLGLVIVGSLMMGISLFFTGLFPIIWVILTTQFLGGLGNAAQNIGMRSLVLERVPKERHSQAFAAYGSFIKLAIIVGFVAAGPAAERIPQTIFVIAGLAVILVTLVASYDMVREVRFGS